MVTEIPWTPPDEPAPDYGRAFAALLATGMGFLEAFQETLAAVPEEDLPWQMMEAQWAAWIGEAKVGKALARALNLISHKHRTLAARAIESLPPGFVIKADLMILGGALGDTPNADGHIALCGDLQWFRTLPPDLRIEGSLVGIRLPQLVGFPHGFHVGGDISISNCPEFLGFSTGLQVAGRVRVVDCPRWDGRFPQDATICGRILTDEMPLRGLPLADYRRVVENHRDSTPDSPMA